MQKGAVNTFTTPFSVCDSLAWIRTKTKRIKISCANHYTTRPHRCGAKRMRLAGSFVPQDIDSCKPKMKK